MRLKKITLNNFRCFEHLEINLHPRLTVFVGENGAGKTAVLDGIATALSPVLTYLSSANQRLTGRSFKDTDFRMESWEGKNKKERWGPADYAQVVAETFDGLRWDSWKSSSVGKEPFEKYGLTDLRAHLIKVADSYKTATPALTPVLAYYGAQRGYIKVPERLRGAKENHNYPAAALLGSLDSMSDFRAMLAWFDLEESSELRANKGVVDEDFEESPALAAVRASIKKLLGGAFKNPHFNKDHKFALYREGGGSPLLVNQLSQGYQSMLALAMDFSRRLVIANPHLHDRDDDAVQAIDEAFKKFESSDLISAAQIDVFSQAPLSMSAPAVMLVDEIDLHLHPSWQQRVLGDLMRTFPLTQFIVTTHSPQVLSTVKRENIRVISQGLDGKFIAEPPLAMTYGEPSGDVMQSVMNVDPQPPVAEKVDLQRLTELVDQGQYETDEVEKLNQNLATKLGTQHPQLQRLQRSIQRQKALKQS